MPRQDIAPHEQTGERPQEDPRLQALKGLLEVEGMQNVEMKEVMYPFSGKWVPSVDPTLIGPENFQTLVNMRYNDASIEGINGYEYRNNTALTTYTDIINGIQLRTQGRTQENYVLAHATSLTNQGRIYLNKTAIGTTGDFATGVGERSGGTQPDYLWEDASTGLTGRFAKGPGENIAYCNGEENFVWSGDETTIGSVFTTTSSAEANPVDVTDKCTNSRDDADNVFNIGTSRDYLTILTTRPAQGFKFYVETANTNTSAMTVSYWNGTAYTAVSNLTDNTSSGGITLAQTGWVTFDSTVSTCKLHHFEERYLYAYQIYIPATGTADIFQVTYDPAPQEPTNVWDGVYRTATQAQFYDASATAYEDYTLHVAESSTVNTPVGAIMDAMTNTGPDYFYCMFDEQMAGIKVTMLGNLVNQATSTLTVQYWDGSSWTSLTSGTHDYIDGTSSSSKTLAQSGVISWNPPSDEEKTTLFGIQGYAYRWSVSATLTDTTAGKATEDVVIDLLTGIPAPASLPTFKFPIKYKDKLMLCNYAEGNQGNRIDYSLDGSSDIFNGENTSLDGFQSIFVGGSEHLTCGAQLYNRFGSSLVSSLVLFKNNEIYLLTGDSPIDYQLFPVSFTIGCPAPLTLATAEVGFELGENVARNVSIFVSNAGPMMYDGAVLYPIRGMEKFFDPNESESVNFDYLDTARGWFDPTKKEYNMLLPVGDSTTLNAWYVYDVVRKKWFSKDTGDGDAVQCGFNVSATNGDQYVYGGTLVGKLVQLETGASWGGAIIDNEITTADFFPSGNEWETTRIRRLKFVCRRVQEQNKDVNYFHFVDTNAGSGLIVGFTDATTAFTNSGTAGVAWTEVTASDANSGTAGFSFFDESPNVIDISQSGTTRIVRTNNDLNEVGWCHSFRFIFSSNESPKGMQPLMWGVQYEIVRKDY